MSNFNFSLKLGWLYPLVLLLLATTNTSEATVYEYSYTGNYFNKGVYSYQRFITINIYANHALGPSFYTDNTTPNNDVNFKMSDGVQTISTFDSPDSYNLDLYLFSNGLPDSWNIRIDKTINNVSLTMLNSENYSFMPSSSDGSYYFTHPQPLGWSFVDYGKNEDLPGYWSLKITGEPAAVPEPSTIFLLGVGLAGLGFFGRRSRNSKQPNLKF